MRSIIEHKLHNHTTGRASFAIYIAGKYITAHYYTNVVELGSFPNFIPNSSY